MSYLIITIILLLSLALSIYRVKLQEQTNKTDYWRDTAITLQTEINDRKG